MVLFNYSTKELTAKIVYYGPGLGGKTTNLQWIHEKLPIKNKGKMLSLATETDRTLFFDFLPIELGTIRGMKTRVQLYTVPGQVFYNATRRMVLKGADSVVFVADSQEAMLEANLESMDNLRQNLEANEIDAAEIPMVMQFNKRDLPNALPIEILNERLNPRNLPFNEAIAIRGLGVEETLKTVTGLVFRSLASKYGGGESVAPGSGQTPATPRPVPAVPAAPSMRPPSPAPPPPSPPRPAPAAVTTLPPRRLPDEDISLDLEAEPLELAAFDESASISDSDALPLEIEEEEEAGPPPAPPTPPRKPPSDTLVRSQEEAAELRRKAARSTESELLLEQIEEEDEEDIAEISFEPPPPPLPPPPSKPVAASPAAPSARATAPPTAPSFRPSVPPPPPPTPPPISPSPPAVSAPVKPVTLTPVTLTVPSLPAQAALTIPVEVTIRDGAASVVLQLQIALDIRLRSSGR